MNSPLFAGIPPLGGEYVAQSVLLGDPEVPGWEETGIVPSAQAGDPGLILTDAQVRMLAARLQPGDRVCIPFPDVQTPSVFSLLQGAIQISEIGVTLTVDETTKSIPLKEFDLLRFFVRNPKKLIPRDALYRALWGSEPFENVARTVDVHIKRVRKHLRPYDGIVETVRSQGYMLAVCPDEPITTL